MASARGRPAVTTGLREIEADEMEMADDAHAIHRYIGTVWVWLEGYVTAPMPGAETGLDVLERIDSPTAEMASAVSAPVGRSSGPPRCAANEP